EFFRVDQRGAAQADIEQVGEGAGAGRDQATEDLGAVVGEREDEAANILARHAGGIGGPDQRADRGAGDGGGFAAHLVDRLEHRDMREPARATAAQCKREALAHRAPASRAYCQALTASGRTSGAIAAAVSLVAVPSRTRPTMPCRMAASRK